MAKTPTDIRSLARAHTRSAIATLAGIMRQRTAPPMARIAAAKALLERGWGRTRQQQEGSDGPPKPRLVEILRTIVDPNPRPDAPAAAEPRQAVAVQLDQPAADDLIGRAARAVVCDTTAASPARGDPRWRAGASPLAPGGDDVIARCAFVPP